MLFFGWFVVVVIVIGVIIFIGWWCDFVFQCLQLGCVFWFQQGQCQCFVQCVYGVWELFFQYYLGIDQYGYCDDQVLDQQVGIYQLFFSVLVIWQVISVVMQVVVNRQNVVKFICFYELVLCLMVVSVEMYIGVQMYQISSDRVVVSDQLLLINGVSVWLVVLLLVVDSVYMVVSDDIVILCVVRFGISVMQICQLKFSGVKNIVIVWLIWLVQLQLMVGIVVLVGVVGNDSSIYSRMVSVRMMLLICLRKIMLCLYRLIVRLCMCGRWYDGSFSISGCLFLLWCYFFMIQDIVSVLRMLVVYRLNRIRFCWLNMFYIVFCGMKVLISSVYIGRCVEQVISGVIRMVVRWLCGFWMLCVDMMLGIVQVKLDSSGMNEWLDRLVVVIMWLSRNVVCGRQLDFFSIRMKKNRIRICGRNIIMLLMLVMMLLVSRLVSGFFGNMLLMRVLSQVKLVLMLFINGVVYVYIVWKIRNIIIVRLISLNIGCSSQWFSVLLIFVVCVGICMVIDRILCILVWQLMLFFGFGIGVFRCGIIVLRCLIRVLVFCLCIVMVFIIGMFSLCFSVVMFIWMLWCWVVLIMFRVIIIGLFSLCSFSVKCRCRCRLVVLIMYSSIFGVVLFGQKFWYRLWVIVLFRLVGCRLQVFGRLSIVNLWLDGVCRWFFLCFMVMLVQLVIFCWLLVSWLNSVVLLLLGFLISVMCSGVVEIVVVMYVVFGWWC